jgi:hypothetical protein
LPASIAERLRDYRAQNIADWVMYRKAIAEAATKRGWAVHWFGAKRVIDAACNALDIPDPDAYFRQLPASVGPPWQKDHKIAMAAIFVAHS